MCLFQCVPFHLLYYAFYYINIFFFLKSKWFIISNIVKVITTKEYLQVKIYFLFTLKEGVHTSQTIQIQILSLFFQSNQFVPEHVDR